MIYAQLIADFYGSLPDTRSKVGGVVAFLQTGSDMDGLSDESEVRAYQAGAYAMATA